MFSQWKTASSPRPKKGRQVNSIVKTVLIAFFKIDGLVHYAYVPRGQTVNKQLYKKSCIASAMLCVDIALRSGVHAIESCTMTMSLQTGLLQQLNFWRNTTFRPSLLPWPCSLWLLLLPATEENNEESLIQLRWKDSSKRDKTNEGYYKKWLPEVLSSVAGTLQ